MSVMLPSVIIKNEDGDKVRVELDPHWLVEESENVATVHVRRHGATRSTILGRIDRKERVYHTRHHGLKDWVRWSDRTTTLGLEELILAGGEGVSEISYLDERNAKRYTISMDEIRSCGYAALREKIGWRWVVPLEHWNVRRTA